MSQTVSLREYFERLIETVERRLLERVEALEKLVMARLAAIELARTLERETTNTRLETMNEVRGQLATQKSEFVTTERLESLITLGQADRRLFTDKIDALEAQFTTSMTLAREQTQKDLDVQRGRTDDGFKTMNADIRSLRESRSAGAGIQNGVRDLVPWLALAASIGCSGITLALTIIGMLGAGALFLATHR